MIITVRVAPGARKNQVYCQDGKIVKVALTAPPVEGKANEALIEILADHLNVRRSQLEIIKGLKSRDKVINIKDV